MKLLTKLSFLLLLLIPVSVTAEIPRGMVADFAPLSGYIIMPIGDEFLVDLDASASLQEGDILTLVVPGEKVIHPVTKEILGTLDVAKGYLQVTRIKSGYSYAKLLYSTAPPKKGDQIKRFEQVPTTFSATPANDKLFSDLKIGLPQLNWLNDNNATQAMLNFTLHNNILTVKNNSGTILKSYRLIDGELVAAQPSPGRSTVFTVYADPSKDRSPLNKAVNKIMGSIGLSQSKDMTGGSGIIRNQQALQSKGVWVGPNLQGNPVGIIVADLDNDGRQETAVAMQNRLLITSISQEKIIEEAEINFPGLEILSCDVIDLDQSGTPEIYLSALRGEQLASLVVEFDGTGYLISLKNIPWFFRATEYPGAGRLLIGQQLGDYDRPFNRVPFKVLREPDGLKKGENLNLPSQADLFSFAPFSSSEQGQLYAYLTQGDYLNVISDSGVKMWESSDYFGGTETAILLSAGSQEIVDPIYIQKRILHGPSGEILVAQNDGQRTIKRFRMFKNSRVIALTWDGFTLQESWRTAGQNGYLADFALADADNDGVDELVMVVKFKHKSLLSKARSAIVIYELN